MCRIAATHGPAGTSTTDCWNAALSLASTYIPWHPVGGEDGHRACAADRELRGLATKYEVSPYQLLIAWLLALGKHVLPIPGATRVSSVVDSLKATRLEVSANDLETIGALAR